MHSGTWEDGRRKMRRLRDVKYTDYVQWAKMNTAKQVYPCSIAEGFQAGDIYVNDDSVDEAVFFLHSSVYPFLSWRRIYAACF